MDPARSLLANRLSRTLRSCLRFSETRLATMQSASRSYSAEKDPKRRTLSWMIFPLANPSVSLVPELDRWMAKTKSPRAWEVQHIVRELRKRNRHKEALEVSEWMEKKGIVPFKPSDHAVQLDLIGRVHGLASAETYFDSMAEESKSDKTYGALLNCYVRDRLTEKALSHMEKMKKMGFASSALTYNDIMSLYTNTGQYMKVPSVLDEMKENGVLPDNFSYRICINSYGARSDVSGMEKVLEEMEQQPHIVVDWNTYAVVAHIYIKEGLVDKATDALKKSEEKIEKRSGSCYTHLISLYGHLKDKSGMRRLWELQKLNCKKFLNRDYTTMLGALVKLDEFEEAETLLKEWESSGNLFDFRVPNCLLLAYCEKGLVEKAEAKLKDFVKKGKTPISNSWGILATGFAEKGDFKKAHQYMEKALCSYAPNAGWQPNPKVVASILRWLGDEAEIRNVETLVELLKFAMPGNRNMYHALIKANIRAGKEAGEVIKSMKADGIEEDDETKEILKLQGTK